MDLVLASLTEAAGSLIAGGNLIKKVLFPAEVLPIVSVLANMVHFFLGCRFWSLFLIVLPALARAVGPRSGFRSPCSCSWCSRRPRADPRGADGALPRHPRHPGERPDALVLRDADHLSLVQESVRRFKPFFDLNPFTHLAISYQEILFFPARSATGSGCWRSARRRWCCSSPATGCSTGCATRSRRRYDAGHRARQRLEDLPPLRRPSSSPRSRARCCSAASCATCSRAKRSRR